MVQCRRAGGLIEEGSGSIEEGGGSTVGGEEVPRGREDGSMDEGRWLSRRGEWLNVEWKGGFNVGGEVRWLNGGGRWLNRGGEVAQ